MAPHKLLIFAGIVLFIVGMIWGIARFFHFDLFRLPGDVYIEKTGWSIYIPITSMMVIMLVLHLLIRLFRWMGFFN